MAKDPIKRLAQIRGRYPLFNSSEGSVIDNVSTYLNRATRSLIPECALNVAEAHVDCYQLDLTRQGNSCIGLVRLLRNSIQGMRVTLGVR